MLARASAVLALALGAVAAPAAASLPTGQWPLAAGGSLRAPLAWQQATGSGIVVAVLETGAQLDRAELRGHIWTNPGEIPRNGRDDDGDGIVDDVHGADFANGDGTPADDNGHGTHVAGIIAAHGIVHGLAPGATILPVKVLGPDKSGNAHWLAQGIAYAVARGARIINVSVNGDGESAELESAIRDRAARPRYPVSYGEPALKGGGAADAAGRRPGFSNFGPGVDVTAPGADIISLGVRGLAYRSGTSMAAAYASATLALEASVAPGLAGDGLRGALLRSTGPNGAVDAAAAVRAVRPTAKPPRRRHRARGHAKRRSRQARR